MEGRKVVSLKLILDVHAKAELDELREKYKRAVNFFTKKSMVLFSKYPRLSKRDRYQAMCTGCGKTDEIVSVATDDKFCNKCWYSRFSDYALRKRFIGTKKRMVPTEDSVRVAVPCLSGTYIDMAWNQSKAILKSNRRLMQKRREALAGLRRKLKMWVEVMEDAEIKEEGHKIKARVIMPPKGREKVSRYKHAKHSENWRGVRMSEIPSRIEKIEKSIRRLERMPKPPVFGGQTVNLERTTVRFLNDHELTFTVAGRPHIKRIRAGFHAANVKREKSRAFFNEFLQQILREQKENPVHPSLLFKRGEYFLRYPVRVEFHVPEPDENFAVIGIDRGVSAPVAVAAINKPHGKPHHLWLEGKEMIGLHIARRHHKRRLQRRAIRLRKENKRLRLQRKQREMKEHSELSKILAHEISSKVVREAKRLYPNGRVVIAMENLKELKPVRGKKRERTVTFKLGLFMYRRIADYLSYKTAEAGIPIAYVPPAGTSITCSKCGHEDPSNRPRKKGFFRCIKCGFSLNADLNAAINIANRFYEQQKINREQKQ